MALWALNNHTIMLAYLPNVVPIFNSRLLILNHAALYLSFYLANTENKTNLTQWLWSLIQHPFVPTHLPLPPSFCSPIHHESIHESNNGLINDSPSLLHSSFPQSLWKWLAKEKNREKTQSGQFRSTE